MFDLHMSHLFCLFISGVCSGKYTCIKHLSKKNANLMCKKKKLWLGNTVKATELARRKNDKENI
jgi:hypothetical protein